MRFGACAREKEISELLKHGHWPHACAAELHAHANSCRMCSDLVLVTVAFRKAQAESVSTQSFDSPGVLWWRAQLRRRNAAVERVGRPIVGAQIFALCINLLLAVRFIVLKPRHGFSWLSELPQSQTFHLEKLWSFAFTIPNWNPALLILSLSALALLSGVLVYLATEKQ
jgi:hypothetical protein